MRLLNQKRVRYMVVTFLAFLNIVSGFFTVIAAKKSEEEAAWKLQEEHVRWMEGVVDRVEEGYYSILLETEEIEFVIPTENVNEKLSPNTWLNLLVVGGEIMEITINLERTNRERSRVSDFQSQLRQRKAYKKICHPYRKAYFVDD
jgi:hypothetical protein